MNTIVSNIRVPENKYQMWKAMAAEEGISLNEFLIRGIDMVAIEKQLGKMRTKKMSMSDAMAGVAKMPNKPMGWSQDDEAIYG